MADQPRPEIIKDNPIGNGLDKFRTSFNTLCTDRGNSCTLDVLDRLEEGALRKLIRILLRAAQNLPAADLLPATTRSGTLRDDLLRLELSLRSDDFDLDRIKPLLNAALSDHPEDALVWDRVYDAVTESTPPPRPIASSLQQTPWLRNTGSFANSSEHRKYMDNVLKEELGPMYVDLRDFHKTYFGSVPNLASASKMFFDGCLEGSSPLFDGGWRGWPEGAKQDDVLSWFANFSDRLAAFAKRYESAPTHRRRPLAKPDEPIAGSIAERKMDIGFVDDPRAEKDSRCHWSQILVPGELKSNPSADIPSKAWLDLGRYAREVLAAQDTRRFVLGFTLCGSSMRIWAFDRLGAIASEQFDINKDGLQFVSTILGFLWMSEEELGFDPTIMTAKGQRFIEIERDGTTERLVLKRVMKRARCVAGRATTCWKAYREDDPDTLFVVKDSWQYPQRDDEGVLLCEATSNGAVHVARYYHHETVRVRNADDDVQNNVRKGDALPNRVHRRVILSDYGIPIYKAGSQQALLGALADCIEGHKSLRQKAGLLHRDISIGNLMVDKDNRGFLIDLDLAIHEQRVGASGAKGKTGTRAFMAIGALLGEQHSFMHDLESFFWVLFWICIHCDGPVEGTVVAQFDKWNYADTEELAQLKKGQISDEGDFIRAAEKNFTPYYKRIVPWVNRLRKAVFPNGRRWENEDSELYTQMRDILGEARKAVAD
ncbi:hypothetical protein N0V88_000701 [Collariella sp. IMI 366227]|nr:hypothetical protein N0V88_000701 [Collariella sp. IMI 366227]